MKLQILLLLALKSCYALENDLKERLLTSSDDNDTQDFSKDTPSSKDITEKDTLANPLTTKKTVKEKDTKYYPYMIAINTFTKGFKEFETPKYITYLVPQREPRSGFNYMFGLVSRPRFKTKIPVKVSIKSMDMRYEDIAIACPIKGDCDCTVDQPGEAATHCYKSKGNKFRDSFGNCRVIVLTESTRRHCEIEPLNEPESEESHNVLPFETFETNGDFGKSVLVPKFEGVWQVPISSTTGLDLFALSCDTTDHCRCSMTPRVEHQYRQSNGMTCHSEVHQPKRDFQGHCHVDFKQNTFGSLDCFIKDVPSYTLLRGVVKMANEKEFSSSTMYRVPTSPSQANHYYQVQVNNVPSILSRFQKKKESKAQLICSRACECSLVHESTISCSTFLYDKSQPYHSCKVALVSPSKCIMVNPLEIIESTNPQD